MQRLCRFYDFRPMAEPRPHTRSKNSDVKIYRAEITSRPTRGSEIFGELRLGFPGLEAALAIFPLHVLIGSALSTIEGHSTARWCRQTHRLALHRCVHWARGGRIDRPSPPTAESAPSSRWREAARTKGTHMLAVPLHRPTHPIPLMTALHQAPDGPKQSMDSTLQQQTDRQARGYRSPDRNKAPRRRAWRPRLS